MSVVSKKMWDNPNHIVNSDEYRQTLSDRMTKAVAGQTITNPYSRTKSGKYNINGKSIFFRSTWEANYALYLDFLEESGNIQCWGYETRRFEFTKIKRGTRSYTPDFEVTNNDGSVEYHEVKGWMDAKSKTRLKRMSRYYPKVKLIVIDSSVYRDIKSKVGKMLKFY